MNLLEKVPYIWISHFHPDHLNLRSLLKIKARKKKILLSYQYSNRMANDLKNAGLDVIILPARNYITLDGDIKLASFPILNTVDSGLIIKCKNNVIVNLNDTLCDPQRTLKKEISKSKIHFF